MGWSADASALRCGSVRIWEGSPEASRVKERAPMTRLLGGTMSLKGSETRLISKSEGGSELLALIPYLALFS